VGRLPFDPDRFGAREASKREAPEREAPALTVSQAAGRITSTLRTHLSGTLRIVGQVSGFRERTHWYFDIKDAGAVLGCVVWRSTARRLSFVPEDGQEVVVSATVDFYERQGRLSLIVTRIEPVGAGALEIAYRALCEELRALGWFDVERKRPLPVFPRRVGVITSRSSAALQDVLDTMRRRCPAVDVGLIDVRVQGDGAAGEIVRAIERAGRDRERLGLDAILLTRGGGSMEDLWAFNERVVAEAIVKSAVPVVAAIGHETDTTIAELVADARGATPTQAAMLLTPDRAALSEQIDACAARLDARARQLVDMHGRHLRSLASRPVIADPRQSVRTATDRMLACERHLAMSTRSVLSARRGRVETRSARLERHRPVAVVARREARLEIALSRLRGAASARLDRDRLDRVESRLGQALGARLGRSSGRVEMIDRELRAVGPIGVLERGFSCTTSASGALVRSPGDVTPGERITTRVAEGSFESIVDGKRPRRTRVDEDDAPQMDLFGAEP